MKCSEPECNGRNYDKEKEMQKDYGFYCHMVPSGDPESPTGTNYHTHGIPISLNHPDVQIVMALPPQIYGPIIHSVYNFIKEGNIIEVGKYYDDFLQGLSVEFAWATECGRDILRMILPDKEGNTSFDTIDNPYKEQWHDTTLRPSLGEWNQ